jgi:benzoyl-CoA-dihydrodiol lyase
VVTSGRDRVFCSGANIYMLGSSTHSFKVNFCKYTNETRLGLEDASAHSGLKALAAVNGPCAGGGYELALACDEILLVDDASSAVSLPEVPLLGVLPGTGGLTRVVDKRKVRRDLADVFASLGEGVKGKRAVQWRLVDETVPLSKFPARIAERARSLASASPGKPGPGVTLAPLGGAYREDGLDHRYVTLDVEAGERVARLTVRGPGKEEPATPAAMRERGSELWALRAFRELDDALLDLRFNRPEIGVVLLQTSGDAASVLAVDAALEAGKDDWFVNEVRHHMKRVLKRLDLTARTFLAVIDKGSCFAGCLAELALAADRSYMLAAGDGPRLALSAMNRGPLPMANGLTRLATRFLGGGARGRPPLRRRGGARRRSRHVRARRHRLGGRGAPRHRGAGQHLAGRADGDGGEPALRRPRDDGDEDLRPLVRVAELDLPAPERGGREGRAHAVRTAGAGEVQLDENVRTGVT